MEKTYNTSETFILKMKRNYKYMMVSMPLGIIIIELYYTMIDRDMDIALFIGILSVAIILMEVEIIILSRIMMKKIGQNQIIIGENFIQRKAKKLEEPVYFEAITKIHIKREKNGEINYIDLSTKGKRMRLCGIELLEEIAGILQTNKGDAIVKDSSLKMNYDSPVVYGIIFIVTLAIFLVVKYITVFPIQDLVVIAMGIWMLFFKPVSRAQGKRFRIVELIIGAVLIIGIGLPYILNF